MENNRNLEQIKNWGINFNFKTRENINEKRLPSAEEILKEVENGAAKF